MPYFRAGCVVNSAALFPSSPAKSYGRFNSAVLMAHRKAKAPLQSVWREQSNPTRTRALHSQTSTSLSKTYNGEWALVGEFVKQPGQFAIGEFRHLALREYHPLSAEAVRAAGMTWKKDPSQWSSYRIAFASNQQGSVLCERCRLKRHDAKQRDDSEVLGVVIHLPNATAAIHENPKPGVQMPASDSQTP